MSVVCGERFKPQRALTTSDDMLSLTNNTLCVCVNILVWSSLCGVPLTNAFLSLELDSVREICQPTGVAGVAGES